MADSAITLSWHKLLGLQQVVPFGEYHGVNIGVMGVHPEGLTLGQVLRPSRFPS